MLHNLLAQGLNEPHPFHLLLINAVYFSCSFDFTVKKKKPNPLWAKASFLEGDAACDVLWESGGISRRCEVLIPGRSGRCCTLVQLTGANLPAGLPSHFVTFPLPLSLLHTLLFTWSLHSLSLFWSSACNAEFESCGNNCQDDLWVKALTSKRWHLSEAHNLMFSVEFALS